MSKTVKEKIGTIILLEYEDEREEFRELNQLLNKFDEEQLKELHILLTTSKRVIYDMIFDFYYNKFQMDDL